MMDKFDAATNRLWKQIEKRGAMMDTKKWALVTRERFRKFVDGYGKNLVYDVCAIFDPPIGSYNDFSDGKVWPESVVCYVSLHIPNKYFILRSLLEK